MERRGKEGKRRWAERIRGGERRSDGRAGGLKDGDGIDEVKKKVNMVVVLGGADDLAKTKRR
jgi:hypothetical protein